MIGLLYWPPSLSPALRGPNSTIVVPTHHPSQYNLKEVGLRFDVISVVHHSAFVNTRHGLCYTSTHHSLVTVDDVPLLSLWLTRSLSRLVLSWFYHYPLTSQILFPECGKSLDPLFDLFPLIGEGRGMGPLWHVHLYVPNLNSFFW